MGELRNALRGTPESSDRQRSGVFFYFFLPQSLDWQGFSVCAPPSKWEVEALIYSEKMAWKMSISALGTRDHASGARDHVVGPRDHTLGHVIKSRDRVITRLGT